MMFKREHAANLISTDIYELTKLLKEIDRTKETRIKLDPFLIAFFVIYGRLFVGSNPNGWKLDRKLQKYGLGKNLCEIHNALLRKRHKVIAHSDLGNESEIIISKGDDVNEYYYVRDQYVINNVCIYGADNSEKIKEKLFSNIKNILDFIYKNIDNLLIDKSGNPLLK